MRRRSHTSQQQLEKANNALWKNASNLIRILPENYRGQEIFLIVAELDDAWNNFLKQYQKLPILKSLYGLNHFLILLFDLRKKIDVEHELYIGNIFSDAIFTYFFSRIYSTFLPEIRNSESVGIYVSAASTLFIIAKKIEHARGLSDTSELHALSAVLRIRLNQLLLACFTYLNKGSPNINFTELLINTLMTKCPSPGYHQPFTEQVNHMLSCEETSALGMFLTAELEPYNQLCLKSCRPPEDKKNDIATITVQQIIVSEGRIESLKKTGVPITFLQVFATTIEGVIQNLISETESRYPKNLDLKFIHHEQIQKDIRAINYLHGLVDPDIPPGLKTSLSDLLAQLQNRSACYDAMQLNELSDDESAAPETSSGAKKKKKKKKVKPKENIHGLTIDDFLTRHRIKEKPLEEQIKIIDTNLEKVQQKLLIELQLLRAELLLGLPDLNDPSVIRQQIDALQKLMVHEHQLEKLKNLIKSLREKLPPTPGNSPSQSSSKKKKKKSKKKFESPKITPITIPPDAAALLRSLSQLQHADTESKSDIPAQAYIVGGFIRDELRGNRSNDIDIVCYGIGSQLLLNEVNLCEQLVNANCKITSLTIIKTLIENLVQIELNGTLYDIYFSPDPLDTDIRNRCFTCNTLLANAEGEVIETIPGSIKSAEQSILEPCDPQQFFDDPVRVLRYIKLSACDYKLSDNEKFKNFNQQLIEFISKLQKQSTETDADFTTRIDKLIGEKHKNHFTCALKKLITWSCAADINRFRPVLDSLGESLLNKVIGNDLFPITNYGLRLSSWKKQTSHSPNLFSTSPDPESKQAAGMQGPIFKQTP